MLRIILVAFCISLSLAIYAQPVLPYKDPRLPVEQRVKDLLARMTPEEKFWQCFMIPGEIKPGDEAKYKTGIFGFQVSAGSKGGNAAEQLLQYNATDDAKALANKINAIQKYFVESSRLGIPIIAFDEALHGLVRQGATAFPQSIALGATWDTAMMSKVANAIALETKQRGIRQILSPVVNLATDVRWGRTEETYGEDPFLTAQMGISFVKAFEQKGVVTTPKHFLANVGDGGRDSYPIHYTDDFLAETHLYPFRELIEKGGARSIMTAYNSVNGKPSSANDDLLISTLKNKWGFKGFVISDAGAVGGSLVLHNTSKDYPQSAEQVMNNGLDVIFQTDYDHYKLFMPPFLDGRINAARLDDAVSRVLRIKFELGLFEDPYVKVEDIDKYINMSAHRKIAQDAAAASFVLLKNQGALPVKKTTGSIALIGTDAVEARLGGYAGPGVNKISILDGMKKKMPGVKISYRPGYDRDAKGYAVVPARQLKIKGEYFDNPSFAGEPVLVRDDKQINFHWTLFSPDDTKLKKDNYSVRWTGQLTSPLTGKIRIGVEGNDGFRLFVGGKLIIDRSVKQSYHTIMADMPVENGKQYDIRLEFSEPAGNATVKLIWDVNARDEWQKKINDAVAIAKQSDQVIVVAGIHEGEFQDRAFLTLPAHQEELILALAETGKPVSVLLVGGSAIVMDRWLERVQSVVMVWYPGDAGGDAVADMVTGGVNPSGKLPITFPIDESQLPLVYNHKPTGRGDDYHNLSGLPLFPFGFGLSYTSFQYSDIRLSSPVMNMGDKITVSCRVRNTGKVSGSEVVQLYIRDELASVARPVLELKGFSKISLTPGEEKLVSFEINKDMLTMINAKHETVAEPGMFRIMIGSSSRDLVLKTDLELR
ncbi:MAG TPA: glycoside hydrolase family 3 N-terminal domain-containing protein [Chitinophagaceae bacterium]|nr:glycoside hydrolase family 3 N-terminal domain-containing protein [Chitinophagaceae bacterium]